MVESKFKKFVAVFKFAIMSFFLYWLVFRFIDLAALMSLEKYF